MQRARGARALAWTALDHAIASLSNVLVSLAVVRGSGAEGLGKFTVALSAYLVVIGFQRALITDPLLVSGRSSPPRAFEERGALASCLGFGTLGGIVMVVAGLATGHEQLIPLGVVLPIMTAQDGARFVAFRRLEPRAAALMDVVWLGASVVAWVPVESGSVVDAVALWGAGAALSMAAGFAVLRARPARPSAAVDWWRRDAGRLGLALGAEAGLTSAAAQAGMLIVAGLLGSSALGALRAGQIIVGPAILLLTAYSAFALPRLARRATRLGTADALRASASAVALVIPVLAVAWGASGPVGEFFFGPRLKVDRSILAGLVVGTLVAAATLGGVLYLKVTRRGRALVAARSAAAATGLALLLLVATVGEVGLLGWALAGQSTAYLMAVLAAIRVRRSTTEEAARGEVRDAAVSAQHTLT